MAENNSDIKKSSLGSRLYIIILVAVIALGSFNFVGLIAKHSDKKKEETSIQEEISEQNQKIDEDKYLLDEDNELEYIERVAREKYGYAAPGERAFYVSDGG